MTIAKPRIGGLERRNFRVEVRDLDAQQFVVSGYASTTESPYDMGGFLETIKRGAFEKTLAGNPDCQLLINHEGEPLARTTNGSLSLREDSQGLRFDAQLDRHDPDSQRLMRKLASGLLSEASFAFRVVKQDWNSERTQRSISEVNLHRGDVSIVNFGANPNTSVDARARVLGRGYPLSLALARQRALRIRNEAGRR